MWNGDEKLWRANSGAARFQVKSLAGMAQLALCSVNSPHQELYKIVLSQLSGIQVHGLSDSFEPVLTEFIDITMQHQEFWITWFDGDIRVGLGDSAHPFISRIYKVKENDMIGYIKFYHKHHHNMNHHVSDWIYEASPISLSPTKPQKIKGGDLRWVWMDTRNKFQVPADALIGGFEKEPLYIARARHNGSLCPGKYVASQQMAFVPWGGREHQKTEFEILCGYNATWEKTSGNRIPQNAFIAGSSELRNEPLYIGRAVHDGCLINGKIHVIYSTCYLPYNGEEIEVFSFEILVVPDTNNNCRGAFPDIGLGCNTDIEIYL